MAEKPQETPNSDQASELRGQLVKRLAVAGVLVAILLGMLAFFDYLATPPEEPEGPVFTKPVPVAPKKEVSQPVKPSTNLPEPPVAEPPPAPPVVQPPPAPQVANPPAAPAGESKKPTTETPPVHRAVPPAVPQPSIAPASPAQPATRPEARPEARPAGPRVQAPEATTSPAMVPHKEVEPAPVSRPSARVMEATPPPAPVQPAVSRLFSGFLLQAGVFSSPRSAEELHAKLTLSGVPSTLETRVQVGPFRTRQEAENAQQKLKSLGVETILVPPKGAKH